MPMSLKRAGSASTMHRDTAKGGIGAADASAHPIPDGATYAYGTSGFRMAADAMAPVAYRCGVLAALLSAHAAYGRGRVVGVALTASHNPAEDNGIKFIAPDGGLFPPRLEALAERVANTQSLPDIMALVAHEFAPDVPIEGSTEEKSLDSGSNCPKDDVNCPKDDANDQTNAKAPRLTGTARVLVARDTRPSGEALEDALAEGACAAVPGCVLVRYGLATTPEAHVAVRELNASGEQTPAALEGRYLSALADAYARALGDAPERDVVLVVDAANGVGAPKAVALAELVAQKTRLRIRVVNAGPDGDDTHVLNHQCGADWVKTRGAPPLNLCAEEARLPGDAGAERHYAALDGDADRVVFFVPHAEPFVLLDGDRIAALAARTARALVDAVAAGEHCPRLGLAVVQTAYANGASSDYMAGPDVRAPPTFTSTGVKHLHAAAEHHDVAVYFEANGHGTLLLHDRARAALASAAGREDAAGRAAAQLLALADLANPLVGDALADMLLVEAMLAIARMDVAHWTALYAERPSCLLKVAVPDRAAYRTTDADRRVLEPVDVQPAVDALVAGIPGARAFVRPSGTEDYLRVFAEAPEQHDADRLAMAIVEYVKARGAPKN